MHIVAHVARSADQYETGTEWNVLACCGIDEQLGESEVEHVEQIRAIAATHGQVLGLHIAKNEPS